MALSQDGPNDNNPAFSNSHGDDVFGPAAPQVDNDDEILYIDDPIAEPISSPLPIVAENDDNDEYFHQITEPHRSVKRDLGPWQIFFIVISGTVGLGLFTDSGKVLSFAGPWGAILAFTLVGIVVIFVMRCITEMIDHWPISNALVEFVSSFVDSDLGLVVGIAYWCAYSITFATLISAASDLAAFWTWPQEVQIVVCNVIIPVVLLGINLMGVRYYGNVEGVAGALKVLLVGGVCILMFIINAGGVNNEKIGLKYINDGFQNDPLVAVNPTVAVLVGIPITAYAFCGVEIVAITALEAKKPRKSLRWWPTRHIAKVLMLGYIIGIFTFYLNVSWQDPLLVSLPKRTTSPSSIIMIAAINADVPMLPGILNGCLILAVLSAANTALYVSSRALFGLTRGTGSTSKLFRWTAARFGTTSKNGVPMWALIFSALAFLWLPFIHSFSKYEDMALQEIMSGIATVAIILVWAAQCLAFIRYRKWLTIHNERLKVEFPDFVYDSSSSDVTAISRWLSNRQIGAWIGMISCLLTVAVFSSASWWNRGESSTSILAAWIGPSILVLAWLLKKAHKRVWWVYLSNDWLKLRYQLCRLNELISGQTLNDETLDDDGEPSSKESSRQNTFLKPGKAKVNQNRPSSSTSGASSSNTPNSGSPYRKGQSPNGSTSRMQNKTSVPV